MSHCSLFNGLGGVTIVISELIRRKYVHIFEIIGTVVALMGCVVILFDK